MFIVDINELRQQKEEYNVKFQCCLVVAREDGRSRGS